MKPATLSGEECPWLGIMKSATLSGEECPWLGIMKPATLSGEECPWLGIMKPATLSGEECPWLGIMKPAMLSGEECPWLGSMKLAMLSGEEGPWLGTIKLATLSGEEGPWLGTMKLAEDFETWYKGFKWTWRPDKFKQKISAQRAVSVAKERFGNTKLVESGTSSRQPGPKPASENKASGIPAITPLEGANSESGLALLQILPYFEIKRSSKGGYGAFALQDIPPSTDILSEAPLLQANNHNIVEKFELLLPSEKETFMNLASYDSIHPNKIISTFKTNRFETTASHTCGIFSTASRFNHACFPPCTYKYNKETQQMVFTTTKLITKGQEITISYGQTSNGLYFNWGFICDCGRCPPPVMDDLGPTKYW